MTMSRQQSGDRHDSLPGDRSSVALLSSGAISGLTLAVAFGLLALGVESFWVTFVVGFGFVLPMSLGVVAWLYPEDGQADIGPGDGRSRQTTGSHNHTGAADSDDRPAVETLRLRYARGELSETEFERRVQLLLEDER
jgi:Predicted membrane protein (DUF2078).